MKILILLSLLAAISSDAQARSGSGGTTGGNPKAVSAEHFNANPKRSKKLAEAVKILRSRIAVSCLPTDYNRALSNELERLVSSNEIFYFPESVMLGYDRYDGDYGQQRLANGKHQFFKVGAFTAKTKGAPIYFTRDSDAYDAEELALTFVQDLNDHVLQWKDEEALNAVGSMVVGKEACKIDRYDTYKVAEMFPELNPEIPARVREFLSYFESLRKPNGLIRFGSAPNGFELEKFEVTKEGFRFTPVNYYYWSNQGEVTAPVKSPRELEVVFSPFRYVKLENLAAEGNGLGAILRDAKTGVILSELEYSTRDRSGNGRIKLEPICDFREAAVNNSIRLRSDKNNSSCEVQLDSAGMELVFSKAPAVSCEEKEDLDFFSKIRNGNEVAGEISCGRRPENFDERNYQDILGSKDPVTFLNELAAGNEKEFRKANKLPSAVDAWMHKNVLGGRLSALSGNAYVVRDNNGSPYSVYVSAEGTYLNAKGWEDLENDNDLAYQCFFQGPKAGTCAIRYYRD
jgi:hypothetical protein